MLIEGELVEFEARQPRQVSSQIDERTRTFRVQDHDEVGTGRGGQDELCRARARRTASSTMRFATSASLTCSDWLIWRSRANASSAVAPVRPRNRPMAWSMTGRVLSAFCSWA